MRVPIRALAILGVTLALAQLAVAAADDDDGGRGAMTAGPVCGLTRWSVKTLSDPAAGSVVLTPRPATVAGLDGLPASTITPITPRVAGVETTTYRVEVRLVAERLQQDHDIHLIVADPTTKRTMITEFPDPTCRGSAQSAQRAQMTASRAALERACGPAPSGVFRRLAGIATLTGVGFLDEPHHPPQPGAAPNSIELHPVLAFASPHCRAGPLIPLSSEPPSLADD
jgi:hypothetical protein